MRFVIVGPGSLGCWLAAALSGGGHDVQLVHRNRARAEALAESGFQLRSGERTTQLNPPVVTAEAAWADADATIIATKACDVAEAARDLNATTVLAIQNGLGSEETLRERFGDENVLIGIVQTAAFREGAGVVRLVATYPTTVGRLDGQNLSNPQRTALEAMTAAGAPVEIVADIRPTQWGKLLLNAAINPVAAILDLPNGKLIELPAAVELMNSLAGETAAVAAALGIVLPFSDPPAVVREICRKTAGNINSMLADIRGGRRTEIDFINGAVCRAAEPTAVPTPANRDVWQQVKAREARP